MRVLHVSSGNLYGGVETLLATLARLRNLCTDMEPHFALAFEGRLSKELHSYKVPVYQLGSVRVSRPWSVWSARKRLRKLLASQQFDVVVCHMPWSLFDPSFILCEHPWYMSNYAQTEFCNLQHSGYLHKRFFSNPSSK